MVQVHCRDRTVMEGVTRGAARLRMGTLLSPSGNSNSFPTVEVFVPVVRNELLCSPAIGSVVRPAILVILKRIASYFTFSTCEASIGTTPRQVARLPRLRTCVHCIYTVCI